MDEAKTPPGNPGDRSQVAAEKLRALRERANQALDDHRRRLADLESQLNDRVHQLAEEFGAEGEASPDVAVSHHAHDAEVAELHRQLDEGRAKHEKFVEQLAAARRQLDAIQSQPCANCQKAADGLTAADEQMRQLRQELEAAKMQHQEERARHDKFVEQLAQARQALSELQNASGDRAAELIAELESTRAAKDARDAELEAMRADKADVEGRLSAATRDLHILHVEFDDLSVRTAALDTDLSAAKSGSQGLQGRIDELVKQRTADAAEIARLGGLSSAGAESVRQSQANESALQEQVASLQTALSQAQEERDELARKQGDLETAKASLDAALANAKSTGNAEQLRLAESHATAQRELAALGERWAAAGAEKQVVENALTEALAAQQELRASLESATHELARVQEQAVVGAALQVKLDQAHAEIDELRIAAESQKEKELEQLQQKFDLALADVQKLKRESAALREELSLRPEANDQESPELSAVRAERDALILRIGELEAAAAKADGLEAQQARDDLQRRFEMAVDDVRQLKRENAQLREKLASAPKGAAATGVLAAGPLDWAAQRARLVALLEEEDDDGPAGADRKKERATIEGTIAATDRAVAEKEREVAELRAALTTSDATNARQDEHGRARSELLDADEIIAAERRVIADLQQEWEDKVRSAELEISVERARLAREQAALKERMLEMELGMSQAASADAGDAKPRRRWLSALGLGDETEEPKKKK